MTDIDVAKEMIATLKTWVDNEVIPHASEFELPDEYPTQMALQMASFGFFGATIPASYGGLELDNITYARIVEELSRGWMSLAGIINSHLICAKLISRFGSERVCLGSDYPFPLGENPPGNLIEQLDELDDHQRNRMLSETALEFLGINSADLSTAPDQQASTA